MFRYKDCRCLRIRSRQLKMKYLSCMAETFREQIFSIFCKTGWIQKSINESSKENTFAIERCRIVLRCRNHFRWVAILTDFEYFLNVVPLKVTDWLKTINSIQFWMRSKKVLWHYESQPVKVLPSSYAGLNNRKSILCC